MERTSDGISLPLIYLLINFFFIIVFYDIIILNNVNIKYMDRNYNFYNYRSKKIKPPE